MVLVAAVGDTEAAIGVPFGSSEGSIDREGLG
jgi:hypothetical protein